MKSVTETRRSAGSAIVSVVLMAPRNGNLASVAPGCHCATAINSNSRAAVHLCTPTSDGGKTTLIAPSSSSGPLAASAVVLFSNEKQLQRPPEAGLHLMTLFTDWPMISRHDRQTKSLLPSLCPLRERQGDRRGGGRVLLLLASTMKFSGVEALLEHKEKGQRLTDAQPEECDPPPPPLGTKKKLACR